MHSAYWSFCFGTKVFIRGGFPLGSSIMLSRLEGPYPQIGGWFGCGVPFRVLMCYCHGHEKLQEHELNQGHNKENKSQKM